MSISIKNNWILQKIPKRMSFYWDTNAMSYLQYLTVVSFHKHNPDWQIYVYEPSIMFDKNTWITEEHNEKYTGKNYYELFKKLDYISFEKFDFETIGISNNISEIFKSDLIRWYLLDKYGGGWSDMDVLYLQPMHKLNLVGQMIRGEIETTDIVFAYDNPSYLIGFLLSSPNNGFFSKVLGMAKKNMNSKIYQSCGAESIKNHYTDIEKIAKNYKNLHIASLRLSDIYPYKYADLPKLYASDDETYIKCTTLGVHWFNGAPISKIFNNSYMQNETCANNVISNLIKQIG